MFIQSSIRRFSQNNINFEKLNWHEQQEALSQVFRKKRYRLAKKEDENESKGPIEKERKEEAFIEEVCEEENPSEIGEDSNELKTEEE